MSVEITNIAELFAIGSNSYSRDGDYLLMNDIDLDYTDGYIGNTTGDTTGATGTAVYTWDIEDKEYAFGDIVQYGNYFYFCTSPHNAFTVHVYQTEYWQQVGKVSLGWRGFGDFINGVGAYKFTGTFDGQGHTVSNMYQYNPKGGSYAAGSCRNSGLFGDCEGGYVKNLFLDSFYVYDSPSSSSMHVGGLQSRSPYVQMINCHISNSVIISAAGYTNNVGGLTGASTAGSLNDAIIRDCSVVDTVILHLGTGHAGGLSGYTGGPLSVIERSFVKGGSISGVMVGGITKDAASITIRDCYVKDVTIAASTSGGGLVNNFDTWPTGDNTVLNCYVASAVGVNVDPFANGIAGGTPSITNCYYDATIAGAADNGFGTAKTTAEMKLLATFSNYDFLKIWGILSSENDGYPFLAYRPGIYEILKKCNTLLGESNV